jgi:hypothetical protein
MPSAPPQVLIAPSSGVYCPPIVITLAANTGANDVIYYTVQDAETSSDLSSMRVGYGMQQPLRRNRYVSPIVLTQQGRVKISAFIWREQYGEGPHASALYMLDREAPPPSEPATSRVFHDAARLEAVHSPHRNDDETGAQLAPASQLVEISYNENLCSLHFSSPPNVITPMVPFDLNLYLVDAFGFPSAAPNMSSVTVCISAETAGATVVPTICTFVCPLPMQLAKLRLVPFIATSNILPETTSDGMTLGRTGRGGTWNSYANSDPCLAATSQHCGVAFRLASLCRAIVGIHNGVSDPSSESSWRQLPHSFHFSADLADPTTVPAFRIYELGRLVEECGTLEFEIGSEFSIRVRQNGRVAYFYGERVIFTSRQDPVPNAVYSVMTRIATQESRASFTCMRLVAAGTPLTLSIKRLAWKPPMVASEVEKPSSVAIIRAWILGTDFVPATFRAALSNNPVPRWAFAALSLASMFALGATGCQGGHVPALMTHHHETAKPLEQVEERRDSSVNPHALSGALSHSRALQVGAKTIMLEDGTSPLQSSLIGGGSRQKDESPQPKPQFNVRDILGRR